MPSAFVLPPEVLPRSGVTRMIHLDSKIRFVVAMFIEHDDPPPQHADMVMPGFAANLVLRGTGRYLEADGREWPLKPGTLFHRFPGRRHGSLYDPRSGYTELFIVLDEATSLGLEAALLLPAQPVLDIGAPANLIREFRKLQARLAVPEREAPSRLVLVEVLQFLNGLWDRARARSSEDEARKRIHEACRMLEQSADGREPLEEIARDLGLSYATFRKHFREELGVSPGTYRIRQRIQRACRLLPQHSVKCVAAELGYPDPFTFSSQFKAAMGVSPQGFQKRLREGGHE